MEALLIDAHSLIKRCILASALDDLKADGTFTGGVYGTLNTLRSFLSNVEAFDIGPIFAFFDCGVPAYRMELLPDYKSERSDRRYMLDEDTKEKAFEQIGLARQMLSLLGVKCFEWAESEADDCLAGAVKVCRARDMAVTVMSGDKDLWQTVYMGARVWDLGRKMFIDAENFESVAGVTPSTYTTYRTLVGDPSDSIVGCRGCGAVRAVALIREAAEAYPHFETALPEVQLSLLRALVRSRQRPRKFEQDLIEDESFDYLKRVEEAIDLRVAAATFDAEVMDDFMFALYSAVDERKFMAFCKRLSFRSVLGDPQRWLRPFARCALKSRKMKSPE